MTNEELKNITISPEETRETTYFEFGTHEIVISKVKIDKHEDKSFAEIFVENDAAEDRARLWLHTPDTRRISIDTVRKILIHNQENEEIKQKIREKFQQIKNLAEMALKNNKIAVHWKNLKGENCQKIYNDLAEAERAKKWLVEQGVSVADIELAVVKEKINEPERTAE
jgi:hypothetical protein